MFLSDIPGILEAKPASPLVLALSYDLLQITLEEIEDSDLIVHLVDGFHVGRLDQIRAVDRLLEELGFRDESKQKLMRDNALKVFDLPG